jgi:membrane-associated phospholipid phosphatase
MGVHYPTDVLAGAALGTACALVLHLPALRRPLDRLADASSAALDAATRATLGRLPAARG